MSVFEYMPDENHTLSATHHAADSTPIHLNPPQQTTLARKAAFATEFRGHRPAAALLQLQRTHGNQYVQRLLARQSAGVQPEVEQEIHASRGLGQPLDLKVRRQMESGLNADFSSVRVHTDEEADAMSQSLGARAFATGSDVYFRQGAYNPGSSSGRELIAHELTHVVQQSGSAVQTKLTVNQPGDRYEQEADSVAQSVVRQESLPIQRAEDDDQVQAKLEARGIQRAEDEDNVQTKLEDTGIQRQPEEDQESG